MDISQRDPNAEAFYQAISSVPRPGRTCATPAPGRVPTTDPAAGAFLASLSTLVVLVALPVFVFLCAWALVELMTQLPLFELGAGLVVLGAWCWAMYLCKRPWRIEDDDDMVITTLFETRFER